MEIKASRGGMFYGSLFLMTVLCGGLGTLLVWVALEQETVDYGMISFAAIFLLLLAYTIVIFAKKTPIVSMGDEGITYKDRRYGWLQITSADFIQQKGLLGGGKPMDVITLTFDDCNELCIFDKMYSNGYEIRSYLQSRVGADLQVQPKIDEEELDADTIKKNKKKSNLFVFFFLATTLLLSALIVFLNLSKGISYFIMILYSISILLISTKIFRRKGSNKTDKNG